jgi:dTMP kinase
MDPALGLSRALSRRTADERFEGFGESLQEKMRAGFLALAEEFPARFRVIDGTRDIDTVARDVAALVDRELA